MPEEADEKVQRCGKNIWGNPIGVCRSIGKCR